MSKGQLFNEACQWIMIVATFASVIIVRMNQE